MKKISQRLLLLGGLTAMGALANKLVFATSIIKDRLHSDKAHYYQWKFGKIFYTVQGKGPVLILIHDTHACSSANEFSRLINTLSNHYRVYAIDLLGYGRSDKPKLTYTAYMFVQLILDFTKDIVRDQATVIASGKSCAFATMACSQHPDKFNRLIFINPESLDTLKKNPKNQEKIMKFLIELPILGTGLYNLIVSKFNLTKFYSSQFFDTRKISKSYICASHESAHLGGSPSKFVYASNKCQYNNVNITDALASINNNIYIIQGRYPKELAVQKCEAYQHVNPAIECTTIARTKDMPHIEKPESVLEVLSLFLN